MSVRVNNATSFDLTDIMLLSSGIEDVRPNDISNVVDLNFDQSSDDPTISFSANDKPFLSYISTISLRERNSVIRIDSLNFENSIIHFTIE